MLLIIINSEEDLTKTSKVVFTAFSIFYGGCNQSNLSSYSSANVSNLVKLRKLFKVSVTQ